MYFFFRFEIIGYVEDIKQLLFSMTKQERDNIGAKYKAKIPDPLNHQFLERTSKDTAIRRHKARKELRTELFPSGKVITKMWKPLCVNSVRINRSLELT